MQRLLQKAFGIYPGEGLKSLRFARLSIFWALGITSLETLSDGFFLEKIGAQYLPNAYLAIAIGMIGISTLVLYCLRLTSPYRILTVAISAAAAVCIAAGVVLAHTAPPDWFWIAFKLCSRMLFGVLIACSWTFIDQYHDLQDAKRVYSLYSSAYFFGSICSGTLINTALDSLGPSALLAISGISLLCAFAEARNIAIKSQALHDDSVDGAFSGDRSSLGSIVRLIVRSPFTICLLCLSLFVQILLTVTEFSYMDSFGRIFQDPSSAGSIAEFLGKCRAWISACNILTGVFFYSRFVRRAGLSNVMLVTPLFFLGVYGGWLAWDSLAIAILGLIAVDGILFTVEDNSFNLLSNAVPTKLKSKVRIINDSFFEPLGMLLSALLLFALQAQSKTLGLVLTLGALALAFVIRSLYSRAILTNLKDTALHVERTLKDWLCAMGRREQKESRKDIIDALGSSQQDIQLLACESLLSLQESTALPQILTAASSFGTVAKIHLLRLLDTSPFASDERVLKAITGWVVESESPEFCKWANFYLAKRGFPHLEKIQDDLEHPDLLMRGAAILALRKSTGGSKLSPIGRLANKQIDFLLSSKGIDQISMGLDILSEGSSQKQAAKVFKFLSHPAILVKRSAAKCFSKLAHRNLRSYAPALLEHIKTARDNTFRLHCIEALGQIGDASVLKGLLIASVHFRPSERRRVEEIIIRMDVDTASALLSIVKDMSIPERGRILAGKILGRMNLPEIQEDFKDLIKTEIDRAYFYFYFGHTIRNQYPKYNLELLQTTLLTGFQLSIDFIIHLLKTASSAHEPELLVRALRSRNPKIQSHAIESLEKICDPILFNHIAPLIDDLPREEKIAACLRHNKALSRLSLAELLIRLESSPSLYDKVIAARLKAALKLPNWREQLREQIGSADPSFHHFAYELLET